MWIWDTERALLNHSVFAPDNGAYKLKALLCQGEGHAARSLVSEGTENAL